MLRLRQLNGLFLNLVIVLLSTYVVFNPRIGTTSHLLPTGGKFYGFWLHTSIGTIIYVAEPSINYIDILSKSRRITLGAEEHERTPIIRGTEYQFCK
jgi:hypothetical protein